MVDCNRCTNNKTKWCSGCEHNFADVNNFDFYEEVKENNVSIKP